MADECVSCREGVEEEKARNEESRSRESPDKDLQTIFKKLRVDNRPRRLQQRPRSHSLSSEVKDINSKQRRCMLKKPTFVYKSGHLRRIKKSNEAAGSEKRAAAKVSNTGCELEATISASSTKQAASKLIKQGVKSTVDLRDITSGCGEQHRRAQSVGSLNLDDTTPEELAAYFEQLLHIPKPMSAMAEMMYT